MKKQVAIVIPVYKSELNSNEEQSLAQCQKILGHYPIIFVGPDELQTNYIDNIPNASFFGFPSHFFQSTKTYNHLLISVEFYERFSDFDYILIYQLDAYVFRDELKEWCAKGFDYIGSPKLRRKHWENNETINWPIVDPVLLNGGFSLRKIQPIIRFLKWYHLLYNQWPANEDSLFSIYHRRSFPLRFMLKLPSWKQALAFGFEKNPRLAFEMNQEKLPFGCHAWEKYSPSFWKKMMDKPKDSKI
ncbi:DUF5672 family protein [Aquirufa sp. ROCK2-A2]